LICAGRGAGVGALVLLVAACAAAANDGGHYDPLAQARVSVGKIVNREAVIPPQCYTKTDGVSNPSAGPATRSGRA